MKRLSFLFFLVLIFSCFFAGCKTAPAGKTVDALDLLDNKSSFYISIPKEADAELLKRIVMNNIDGLSEKDCQAMLDRVKAIYCGLNRNKSSTEIQGSLEVNIPTAFVGSIFSKKNGWEKRIYKTLDSASFNVYSSNGLDISVPSGRNLCLGRDIESMLETYEILRMDAAESHVLDTRVYEFLKGAETDIRFYANKPQSFLTVLTGTNLNLQLTEVSGIFYTDPDYKDQYILDMTFNFKNEKFMRAGRGLLTLAFGLTAKENSVNKTELNISGIRISKESLYKLLVL